MSEQIHEILLVTRNADATAHIAPMGLRKRDDGWLIAPFRPSRTLENLLRDRRASINTTDDVRIYAGCLTGHRNWPVLPCRQIPGLFLADALSHREVEITSVRDDGVRPEFICRELWVENHRPFQGFNRAQSAVLELAILVSRLDRLNREKIDNEIAYLKIAIDKTAGEREREAWNWLMEQVAEHRRQACA